MPHRMLRLPREHWPARDQALWQRAMQPAALFDGAGAAADWSEATRRKTESGYGHWLRRLQAQGWLDPAQPPGGRVTQGRVQDYLNGVMATLAPYTAACRAQELYDAMRALAPAQDWTWLRKAMINLAAHAEPVTNKRPRLHGAGEVQALGRKLMDEAEALPPEHPDRALRYRDGFMVALLAYRPVRLRSFACMRLGQHLIRRNDIWWLEFTADEMKTRRPFAAVLPASLAAALQRYLDHYREVLLRRADGQKLAGDAVWVSKRGTAMTRRSLPNPIIRRTRDAFGQSLPPHWFRDAAATSIAIEAPAQIVDARHVLGHVSPKTSERYYNQARSIEASRRFQDMLAGFRTPDGS